MSAIPFVTCSDSGVFDINPEAEAVITACKTPVAIVAVAGLYRTGKSFMMNVLTGTSQLGVSVGGEVQPPPVDEGHGFLVGNSVNACTKGIWLWSEPTRVGNFSVFFLDTEGLGSTSRNSTQDSRIFALALLLSSSFIYNSRGVIDGSALDDLSLVANLTELIHVKSEASHSGEDTSTLSQFFPTFLWVLRDFTLRLEDEHGKRINSRQYLENCLKPQPGFDENIAAKNKVRQLIAQYFPERDCLTMVRPAEDEAMLKTLSTATRDQLRPAFTKQVDVLLEKVRTALRPKQMMGKTLNGEMLAVLTKSYVDALNSGAAPTISSAWERVVQGQCSDALRSAVLHYDKTFNDAWARAQEALHSHEDDQFNPLTDASDNTASVDEAVLETCHNEARSAAKGMFWFLAPARGDSTAEAKAKELKEELRVRRTKHREDNVRAALGVAEATGTRIMDDCSMKAFLAQHAKGSDSGAEADADETLVRLKTLHDKLLQHRRAMQEMLAQTIGPDAKGGRDMNQDPLGTKNTCDIMWKRVLREIQQWATSAVGVMVSQEDRILAMRRRATAEAEVLTRRIETDREALAHVDEDAKKNREDTQRKMSLLERKRELGRSKHETQMELLAERVSAATSAHSARIDDLSIKERSLTAALAAAQTKLAAAKQSTATDMSTMQESLSRSTLLCTSMVHSVDALVTKREKRLSVLRGTQESTAAALAHIEGQVNAHLQEAAAGADESSEAAIESFQKSASEGEQGRREALRLLRLAVRAHDMNHVALHNSNGSRKTVHIKNPMALR